MTERIDRDALRKLADAAEPGPWYAHPGGHYVYTPDMGGLVQNWNGDWDAKAGMEFIAAARTAVPALLDALKLQEKITAALRAEARAMRQRITDLAQEARDERGAALDQMEQVRIREARLEAVRELHSGSRLIPGTPVFGCSECGEPNETEPCATIRALDGDSTKWK